MRAFLLFFLSVAAVLMTGVAPCSAQSEPGASGSAQPAGPGVGEIVIDEAARRILHDYYQRNANAWVAAHPDDDDRDQGGGNKNKHKNKKHENEGNQGTQGRKNLPPGIAKKGTLPPGLAKQLVRNGHLPPGLEYRNLPPDLVVQLPRLAPEYRYIIADDRVMLIRAATNVILDILQVPGL